MARRAVVVGVAVVIVVAVVIMVVRGLDLVRELEEQHLARGHRGLAAHDDGAADHLEERLRRFVVDRGTAGEHRPQEPAGTVHPREACRGEDRATVRSGGRHPGAQLGAQGAAGFVRGAALREDRLGDLAADVVPDAHGLRGRERLDLDGGVADDGGGTDHLVGRLVDLEAQLHAGHAHDAQRAQVETAVVVVDLGGVEGALGTGALHSGCGPRGCRRGGLASVVLVGQRVVVVRLQLGRSGPVSRVDTVDAAESLVGVCRVGVLAASENAHW